MCEVMILLPTSIERGRSLDAAPGSCEELLAGETGHVALGGVSGRGAVGGGGGGVMDLVADPNTWS